MVLTNLHRVRVWFGEHIVADYLAEPRLADDYEQAMRHRFAGLHITNEPSEPIQTGAPPPLPSRRLWELTP